MKRDLVTWEIIAESPNRDRNKFLKWLTRFFKFDENNKPTNVRSASNIKKDKHKETTSKLLVIEY